MKTFYCATNSQPKNSKWWTPIKALDTTDAAVKMARKIDDGQTEVFRVFVSADAIGTEQIEYTLRAIRQPVLFDPAAAPRQSHFLE